MACVRTSRPGLQLNDAQLIEIRIETSPFGRFVAALTATIQVLDHSALDEVVDPPDAH
jgi:hypothetical protein